MNQPVERRLAAILAADVAGYSRLMGVDEAGTARALREHHAAADPLVSQHGGRVVKTTGDGVLIEFGSVVGAVQCAIALQELAAERNAGSPDERRMEWRIGIHLGDVLVEGEDILGDGVNIAARLEGIAEPGGICVSEDAFRQVRGKVEAEFDDIGEQSLKNIARPLRVYRIGSSQAPVEPATPPTALPFPDKPSIAVLPFANMSGDPEQEYFADGMVEEIITALARYPSLFVIARNSSFTYKGRAVDVKLVGRELGVRYVLQGGLRKAGNRIRVTAQLVEAETGKHVWAERYDRNLADIFALQDEITEAVTIALVPAIAGAEQQRAMRKPPASLDAWAAYQQALWHFSKFTADDNGVAQKLFQRAIDLDPTFAGGYRGLAAAQFYAAAGFQRRNLLECQTSIEALARRAVALDSNDAEARSWLATTLLILGDYEGALAETERALAISPNLASAHGALAETLIYSGRPRDGLAALQRYMRLDPRDPIIGVVSRQLAVGHYFCREYEAAVEAAKRVIRSYPDFPNTYRWLAAALGQAGQIEEARAALEKAIAVAPASFDMYVRGRVPWMRLEDHAHMVEGLRKAGWHET
jgi:adenylate cyclase